MHHLSTGEKRPGVFLAGVIALISTTSILAQVSPPAAPQLLTATGHPMAYYLALPEGWNPGKKWPIVVSSESSEKEFKANIEQFILARGHLPFILVVPFTVTTSGYGLRTPLFPYTEDTWKMIDRVGSCQFTVEGVNQVLADVQKKYNGEDQYYLTGLEAGTHLIWAMLFRNPEKIVAAAPVAGHYIGRCLVEADFSSNPATADVNIQQFVGDQDDDRWIHNPQWDKLKSVASQHGYRHVSEVMIHGKGHVKMADEVLAYFACFLKK